LDLPLPGAACCVMYTTAMAMMRQAMSTAKGTPPGCLTCAVAQLTSSTAECLKRICCAPDGERTVQL
jgi:hypothetical protein